MRKDHMHEREGKRRPGRFHPSGPTLILPLTPTVYVSAHLQARTNAVLRVVGPTGRDEGDGASQAVAVGVGEPGMGGPSHRGGRNSHGGHRGTATGKRGAGGGGSSGAAQRAVKRRDHWANQLCTPEWMLTVPNDLNGAGSPVGDGKRIPRTVLCCCVTSFCFVCAPGSSMSRLPVDVV